MAEKKGGVDEEVVYSEKIPISRGYRFALAGVIIFFVAAGIVFLALRYWVLAGVMLAFSVAWLAILATMEFHIEITEKKVSFGDGLRRKSLNRTQVLNCAPCTLSVLDNVRQSYETLSGSGVEIHVEGRERPFMVSTNNPRAVRRILSQTNDGEIDLGF